MSPQPMLTIRQVMTRLSLSYSGVFMLIHHGDLRAMKVKKWLIDPVDLETFIERKKAEAVGQTPAAAVAQALSPDTHSARENRFL